MNMTLLQPHSSSFHQIFTFASTTPEPTSRSDMKPAFRKTSRHLMTSTPITSFGVCLLQIDTGQSGATRALQSKPDWACSSLGLLIHGGQLLHFPSVLQVYPTKGFARIGQPARV